MDYEEAKQEAKTHLEELLQEKGIDTRRAFRCLNPAHEDKHPSMSYDPKTQKAKCFSCTATYDAIDVWGLAHGWTDENGIEGRHFSEALREVCEHFNIPIEQSGTSSTTGKAETKAPKEKESTQQSQDEAKKEEAARNAIRYAQQHIEDPEAQAYLQKRGISLETAKAHGLGYNERFFAGNGATWRALIIPTGETSYTARNIDSNEKGKKVQHRGSGSLFNAAALCNAEEVHIVEGEIDALSVIEAGGQAVALCSTSHADKLADAIKQALETPSKPLKCKTLILSLDNDKAGLTAAQNVRDGINAIKSKNPDLKLRLKTINISGEHNDPNEAWTSDPEGFKKALLIRATDAEIEAYKQTSAEAHLIEFYEGVAASADTPAIPTGFSNLDRVLDGGLYEGLYTLPAITSLGKTSLALQIADNIAKQGQDVIYITLEMARSELMAKSLSRLTLEIAAQKDIPRNCCKTVRGITDGKRYEKYNQAEHALIMDAYNEYSRYAQHLYFIEGIGNITAESVRKAVQRHVDITRNKPVLFVDYVQILAPIDPRATDKQNMDKAVLELKRISRDFKIPVVILCSLNRQSYSGQISLAALKESGALEYTSDTVIGLQLQGAGSKAARSETWLNDRMREDPRHIEACILKNRNGERGASLYFDYYPLFNLFTETETPYHTAHEEED